MHNHRLILGLLFFWLLAASCASPAAQPQAEANLQAAPLDVSPAARAEATPSPTLWLPTDPSPPAAVTPHATAASSIVLPLSAVQPATPASEFQLCSPLDLHPLEELSEIISDPYHPPPPGKEDRHHGVDFSYYRRGDRLSIQGVGVQSVLNGTVVSSIPDSFPYGNLVIIETPGSALPEALLERLGIGRGESLYVLYAHLDGPPEVGLGEAVEACQPLGKVGKSGNAGIAHLHLETRIGPPGEVLDRMRYYDTHATPEEQANYVRWRTSGVFRHFDPMNLLTP